MNENKKYLFTRFQQRRNLPILERSGLFVLRPINNSNQHRINATALERYGQRTNPTGHLYRNTEQTANPNWKLRHYNLIKSLNRDIELVPHSSRRPTRQSVDSVAEQRNNITFMELASYEDDQIRVKPSLENVPKIELGSYDNDCGNHTNRQDPSDRIQCQECLGKHCNHLTPDLICLHDPSGQSDPVQCQDCIESFLDQQHPRLLHEQINLRSFNRQPDRQTGPRNIYRFSYQQANPTNSPMTHHHHNSPNVIRKPTGHQTCRSTSNRLFINQQTYSKDRNRPLNFPTDLNDPRNRIRLLEYVEPRGFSFRRKPKSDQRHTLQMIPSGYSFVKRVHKGDYPKNLAESSGSDASLYRVPRKSRSFKRSQKSIHPNTIDPHIANELPRKNSGSLDRLENPKSKALMRSHESIHSESTSSDQPRNPIDVSVSTEKLKYPPKQMDRSQISVHSYNSNQSGKSICQRTSQELLRKGSGSLHNSASRKLPLPKPRLDGNVDRSYAKSKVGSTAPLRPKGFSLGRPRKDFRKYTSVQSRFKNLYPAGKKFDPNSAAELSGSDSSLDEPNEQQRSLPANINVSDKDIDSKSWLNPKESLAFQQKSSRQSGIDSKSILKSDSMPSDRLEKDTNLDTLSGTFESKSLADSQGKMRKKDDDATREFPESELKSKDTDPTQSKELPVATTKSLTESIEPAEPCTSKMSGFDQPGINLRQAIDKPQYTSKSKDQPGENIDLYGSKSDLKSKSVRQQKDVNLKSSKVSSTPEAEHTEPSETKSKWFSFGQSQKDSNKENSKDLKLKQKDKDLKSANALESKTLPELQGPAQKTTNDVVKTKSIIFHPLPKGADPEIPTKIIDSQPSKDLPNKKSKLLDQSQNETLKLLSEKSQTPKSILKTEPKPVDSSKSFDKLNEIPEPEMKSKKDGDQDKSEDLNLNASSDPSKLKPKSAGTPKFWQKLFKNKASDSLPDAVDADSKESSVESQKASSTQVSNIKSSKESQRDSKNQNPEELSSKQKTSKESQKDSNNQMSKESPEAKSSKEKSADFKSSGESEDGSQRQIDKPEKNPLDDNALDDLEYKQCPHCNQKFGLAVADEHIQKCPKFRFNKTEAYRKAHELPRPEIKSASGHSLFPESKSMLSVSSRVFDEIDLKQCPHCNRKFALVIADEHIEKCPTYQFNKSEAYLRAHEIPRPAKNASGHSFPESKSNYSASSRIFDDIEYKQCPHCNRKFGLAVADEHIEKCPTFRFNKTEAYIRQHAIPRPDPSELAALSKTTPKPSREKIVIDRELKECPYCFRKFSPLIAKQHIERCPNYRYNKTEGYLRTHKIPRPGASSKDKKYKKDSNNQIRNIQSNKSIKKDTKDNKSDSGKKEKRVNNDNKSNKDGPDKERNKDNKR